IAALRSFRKQRLIFAASSADNGGERRVFEKPFRGVFIITPIAHLFVRAGFRRAAVNISSFIVCLHGEPISVCLRRAAGIFFESGCESSLFPHPRSFQKTAPYCQQPTSVPEKTCYFGDRTPGLPD